MENLSSLSSDLPNKTTFEQELADLDGSLISEFKIAACAVTKLFKLSGTKTQAARNQGYLDAINDLLTAIQEQQDDEPFDILSWALDKKQMLTGKPQTQQEEHDQLLQRQEQQLEDQLEAPSGPFEFTSTVPYPQTSDNSTDDVQYSNEGVKRRIKGSGGNLEKRIKIVSTAVSDDEDI